jgi:hypothetical protein
VWLEVDYHKQQESVHEEIEIDDLSYWNFYFLDRMCFCKGFTLHVRLIPRPGLRNPVVWRSVVQQTLIEELIDSSVTSQSSVCHDNPMDMWAKLSVAGKPHSTDWSPLIDYITSLNHHSSI